MEFNWIDKKNVWPILAGLLIVTALGKLCQFVSSNANAVTKSTITETELNKLGTINPATETKNPVMVETEVRKRSKNKSWCLSEIAKDLGTNWQEMVKLNNLKDPNLIYPGQKLKVFPFNRNDKVKVSWYGEEFQGKPMADGNETPFNMYDPNIAAQKWLPIGTRVRLTSIDTGKNIVVVVRDRGPYYEDRCFDISYAAAELLGITDIGVAFCEVKVLPKEKE